MKKQWRAYLIGFQPEAYENNQALAERLIKGADFCIMAPNGVPIGSVFENQVIHVGSKLQVIPTKLVCIKHEHGGKVITVQAWEPGHA